MSTLVIYRGLPGSGKTTQAKRFQALHGGTARIAGRDHLRPLLGISGGVGTSDQEAKVTKLQEQLIREGLRADQEVIVDDMNLRQRYVRRLMLIARQEGAEVSFIDLTNVSPRLCVLRDSLRDRQVGEEKIQALYRRFIQGQPYPLPVPELAPAIDAGGELYVPDPELQRAIIVDIDGTVAHNDGHRGWYEYDRVAWDKPKVPVIAAVRAMWHAGYVPLFVSGRSDECREATAGWLNKHVLAGPRLFMRKAGDHRDDSIVKREIFDQHVRPSWNVAGVFDDRQRVVDMWRSLGLTVFQVAPGDF